MPSAWLPWPGKRSAIDGGIRALHPIGRGWFLPFDTAWSMCQTAPTAGNDWYGPTVEVPCGQIRTCARDDPGVELITSRLRLRPFTAADHEAIHAVYSD